MVLSSNSFKGRDMVYQIFCVTYSGIFRSHIVQFKFSKINFFRLLFHSSLRRIFHLKKTGCLLERTPFIPITKQHYMQKKYWKVYLILRFHVRKSIDTHKWLPKWVWCQSSFCVYFVIWITAWKNFVCNLLWKFLFQQKLFFI